MKGLLASKPGRRAWLRRIRKPVPIGLSVYHRVAELASISEAFESLEFSPQDEAMATMHVEGSWKAAALAPGLRRSQRVRLFYYLCDYLALPSDACYALGRAYWHFQRAEPERATAEATSLFNRLRSRA